MSAVGVLAGIDNLCAVADNLITNKQAIFNAWQRGREPRDDVAELIAELASAHAIIRIALNSFPTSDARNAFCREVQTAGLDGEGITRANEREQLLARVGDGK